MSDRNTPSGFRTRVEWLGLIVGTLAGWDEGAAHCDGGRTGWPRFRFLTDAARGPRPLRY